MSEKNVHTIVVEDTLQRGELQLNLMKMMAEEGHDKFLEYERVTDTIILSEVQDGQFVVLETIENFISQKNMVIDRFYEADRDLYRAEIAKAFRHPMHSVFELRYMIAGEGPRWYRVFLMSVADDHGYVTKFAARMTNIQEQKEAQNTLQEKAERDSLSGLYNHVTYAKYCEHLADENQNLLFIMMDVDNFKRINDTYGHRAGDKVIRQVGTSLKTIAKGRGYAGRIGGDEFSVCLGNVATREEAVELCIQLKNAVTQFLNTVPFTISVGVAFSGGRKMSFKELYCEADEAVYYAKDNGKNQIIFKDEIDKMKKQKLRNNEQSSVLTEEEIALDQRMEYIAIVDPIQKKLLYMNEAGRRALGVTLKEIQAVSCFELFKGSEKACTICDLRENYAQVLTKEHAAGLRKYIPDGNFIIQSKAVVWKGTPVRSITFINVNDTEHVERCMQADMENQAAFSKCWSVIMESNSGDTEYEKILHVLLEYYDSDCCALVTKSNDRYQDLYEYHKKSGQGVAEGLRNSMQGDLFERCEILLDKEGNMRQRYIDEVLAEQEELAEILKKKFVHSTMGISLKKFGEIVGVLLIINPRKHLNDYPLLKQIGVFFGADFVRKKLTEDKNYEEDHDVMTGLWSREFYNNGWQTEYLPIFRTGIGVFTADIYQLKNVNKQLGYESGNEHIIALAQMLRKVFTGYSMFRYDDDQVIAICHNVDQKQFQQMVDHAIELIEDMDFEISRGYSWKPEPVLLEAIAEAEEYLAIHRAFLEKENSSEEKLTQKIRNDVLQEISEGNFRMFLQPKYSISQQKVVGAEGLIRLYHSQKGYISPALFIPVLEQQNEVHLIDLFVLERTFLFQKAALENGKKLVPISVNFSKNTLMYPKLIETIRHFCDAYGMPRGMIRIEITETISNMDHLEVSNIARSLHDMGFSISMDDFGTKYSNMAVLTQFEFDTVKIDRSMILNVVHDEKNRTILKHTVAMLKELGMEIVIEGVETKEQVEVLAQLGCDIVQGFYYGRPEAEEQFYDLYENFL